MKYLRVPFILALTFSTAAVAACSTTAPAEYVVVFETYANDACKCTEALDAIERHTDESGVVSIDRKQAEEAATPAWKCAVKAQGAFTDRKPPNGIANPVIYERNLKAESKAELEALQAKGDACVETIRGYMFP